MSFADPEAEEHTLQTFFDRSKFPGGQTTQLRDACAYVQQFIAQELCGTLASDPTFDELWIHFQAILGRIFGKQDATTAGPGGGPSPGVCGGAACENSWMFAATSFYALEGLCNVVKPTHAGGAAGRTTRACDPRLCFMSELAISLLTLLLARPPDPSSPGAKNLFGLLLEPQKVWYPFSCTSPPTPPHTVSFLRREARPDMILFENSRLYTHCLSSPPRGIPQHVVRFHNVPAGGAVEGEEAAEVVRAAPELSLSTLELYLFSFAWYALSSYEDFHYGTEGPGRLTDPNRSHNGIDPSFRQERAALGWRRHGVTGLTQRNPYMTLLKDYMEAFFPHGGGASIGGGNGGASGSGMSVQCELLLRVLVEFWLEGNTVLRPGVLKEQEQQQQAVAWGNSNNNGLRVPPTAPRTSSSYDPTVALLWSDYTPPTDVSVHGLLVASAHLLADPRLQESCRRSLGHQPTAAGVGETAGATALRAGGSPGGGEKERSALTPALEVLRPHVFSFLRVAFSPESTMDTSSSGFSLAVELWLLWMRPWAAPAILRGGSPDSKSGSHPPGSATPRRTGSASFTGGATRRDAGGVSNQGESWVAEMVTLVKDFMRTEPSRAPANSDGTQAGRSTGGGRRTGTGGGGGSGGAPGRDGGYCYDPWGGWVLENYSLYTTILVAFVRKAGNMSFKVNDRLRGYDYNRPYGGIHGNSGSAAMAAFFGDTAGANLRLLNRVTDVFSPGIMSLLASAKDTVRRTREQGEGGVDVGGGGRLRDAEYEVLEDGRKALSSIQGPDLVTLESYQEVTEELLVNIADLTKRTASRHWMDRLDRWLQFAGPGSEKAAERACDISSKVKELFSLPSTWKPKSHGGCEAQGTAQGAMKLADMFHPQRDKEAPLFLSRQGKAQLASGRRACKPWDVAYVGDPMYHPQGAWEMQMLISFWVGVSEWVNARWLGWTATSTTPHDGVEGSSRDSGSVSAATVGNKHKVFDDEGPGKAITRGKEFQQRIWKKRRWAGLPCRVNLRPLADVRATLGLITAMFVLRLACYLSSAFGACVTVLLVALVFRLSTMDY